jgi:hypothetical protein
LKKEAYMDNKTTNKITYLLTAILLVLRFTGDTFGTTANGTIRGWGWNHTGQCNVPSPNSGFIAIAAGFYHSLGLKSNGTIVAWGGNDLGQCTVPSPNSGFIAISAGYNHSLGLKPDTLPISRNDFNQDGQDDILWWYDGSGGKNLIWYMQGAIRTGIASLPAVTDLNWQIVGTGDFNCDGWPDILWRYNGSGSKNCVWYMQGATRTGTATLPAVTDLNWRIENH